MDYGQDNADSSGGKQQAAPVNPTLPDGQEPDPAEKALVTEWLERIQKAKKHWEPEFKQMGENQDLAYMGASKEWVKSGKYVVPILVRHINQAVSQLYAKNPTAVAKRRRRMSYKLWDGRSDSLQSGMQMAAMGDPNAMALIQEILSVRQQNQMLDRLGKTLEIVYTYFQHEQAVNFKQQLKAAVRRTKITKVSYVKIGFQRILEARPEITAQIEDSTSKIAAVQEMLKDAAEGELPEESARAHELKTLLADLQQQEYLVAREGLVFDFPESDQIIIDPAVRHLKSLSGARWGCQEFEGTPEKVEEIYGVDIGDSYTQYRSDGRIYDNVVDSGEECVCRWYEVWDKRDKQWFTVLDGYASFLKPPAEPDIYLDRFWPIFPIVFNETEHKTKKYPPSDIELAKHIQHEYNRSRESLRQHRIAATPGYVEGGGMGEEEKLRLANHAPHEVITLPSLATGEDIAKKLQRLPVAPIDPNLYEVEMHFNDLLRTVGTQEANLGGTSNNTATESSIAENSRGASLSDNVDDLDEVLSELAHAGGQILLANMSKDKVIEIAGEGAVWPDMPESREEISKDLYLDIKAGSSGRPNKATELANRERAMPILLQLPGVNPLPLARDYVELLDMDAEEAIADGLPSITAMNAMIAKMMGPGGPGGPAGAAGAAPTGNPSTDPNQQGPAGAQNAPNPQTNEPGPQPGMPAPMPIGA